MRRAICVSILALLLAIVAAPLLGRRCARRLRPGRAPPRDQPGRQDPLRHARPGPAGSVHSRLPGLLVQLARPDGDALERLQDRRHGSARLQPERSARRRRELQDAAHPRRRRRGGARPRRQGDPGRSRLGRRHRLALRDDASGAGRASDHLQPDASARVRGGDRQRDRRAEGQHRVRAPVRDLEARRRAGSGPGSSPWATSTGRRSVRATARRSAGRPSTGCSTTTAPTTAARPAPLPPRSPTSRCRCCSSTA